MKYIELSEAIAIHEKIIEKTGGLSGYNETQIGYLASALEHIKNDDYYPTITDKITHLIFSCFFKSIFAIKCLFYGILNGFLFFIYLKFSSIVL